MQEGVSIFSPIHPQKKIHQKKKKKTTATNHSVVFIDNGNHAEMKELFERVLRVEELRSFTQVFVRQQHLRALHAQSRQHRIELPHQPDLSNRSERLFARNRRRALEDPHLMRAGPHRSRADNQDAVIRMRQCGDGLHDLRDHAESDAGLPVDQTRRADLDDDDGFARRRILGGGLGLGGGGVAGGLRRKWRMGE